MPANIPINDYANSMFRFERLHPRWIETCARYLREVFGPAIEGATFLDYAFGRGNWSLAALKAGAKRVIAVDAAESNVGRFTDYCRAAGIDAVDIIHGNVLNEPLNLAADILWVYGIASSVGDPDALLSALATERRDDDALAILYGYDRGSLRQVIVDAAREGCLYRGEPAFADDSFLFVPRARLRARDDLTAPAMLWYSAFELDELAKRSGYTPRRWLADFGCWLDPKTQEEFSPHIALCQFAGSSVAPNPEVPRTNSADTAMLAVLARAIMPAAGPETQRKMAIGLFNTHFSSLNGAEPAQTALREDFLFLMHAALRLDIAAAAIPNEARDYYRAALAAAADLPRSLSPSLVARSPLAAFLESNTVRF
jgi:hypothetical protein